MLNSRIRLITIFTFISIFFIALIIRLSMMSLNGMEDNNSKTPSSKFSMRGSIFDRHGNTLAVNQLVSSVFAHPKKFDEKEFKLKLDQLSKVLGVSKTDLIKSLNVKKSFNWLKRKVSKEIGDKIKALKMQGVSVKDEYKRIYPYNNIASHVIGFTGTDNTGLEGLEYSFNAVLKPDINENDYLKINYGNDLYLTIDSRFQEISQGVLKKGIESNQAEGGSIIIADSSNGEILTLANYPDFENNNFNSYPSTSFRNVAIANYYEPGSIFKMFTAAILLEEDLVKEDEKFTCSGKVSVSGREITCVANHGSVTLRDILKKSCNVGIVKASLRIPKKTFYNYLELFGFGKKTDIELAGESSGLLRPLRELTHLSKGMTSFGYEIGVTPIQLLMASASLANGGILYKPLIIKKISNKEDKVTKYFYPSVVRETVSHITSEKIMNLVKAVLEKGGTGEKANIRGLNISGKTSTINIFNHKTLKYDENQVNAAFIGFIPLHSRTLVVLIIVRKPQLRKIASHVVVPMFKTLVENLMDNGLLHQD